LLHTQRCIPLYDRPKDIGLRTLLTDYEFMTVHSTREALTTVAFRGVRYVLQFKSRCGQLTTLRDDASTKFQKRKARKEEIVNS
jgi:hypothetical protein